MRKHAFLLLLLTASWWSSCQEAPPQWPAAAWSVLPSAPMLQNGVVNKYYFHYASTDKYDKSTDIRYYAYELLPQEELRLTIYGPGLDKITEIDFRIDLNGMYCTRTQQYWRAKPQATELVAGHWLNWAGDSTYFSVLTHYGDTGSEYMVLRQQGPLRDTVLLDRPTKRVVYARQRDYTYRDGEDQQYSSRYTDYYAPGLGLVERQYEFAEGSGRLELVKQLSMADFAALRQKVPKRVGYIDPEASLDQYGYFQPCGDPEEIYDYYNGNPDAGFKTGKRGLEKILRARLQAGLLAGESGYLTFRFVINCEGETGWFITEQADLNFQPKAFAPGLVQHVYEILKGLRNWQAGIVRGELVDAYAYVTLKISQGEVIDILP